MRHKMVVTASDRATRQWASGRCSRCGVSWDASMSPMEAFAQGATPCPLCCHSCVTHQGRLECDCVGYARVDLWDVPRLSQAARALMVRRGPAPRPESSDGEFELPGGAAGGVVARARSRREPAAAAAERSRRRVRFTFQALEEEGGPPEAARSYREAARAADEKSKAVVGGWPGYYRALLEEWMKLYDALPAAQSALDFTPGPGESRHRRRVRSALSNLAKTWRFQRG